MIVRLSIHAQGAAHIAIHILQTVQTLACTHTLCSHEACEKADEWPWPTLAPTCAVEGAAGLLLLGRRGRWHLLAGCKGVRQRRRRLRSCSRSRLMLCVLLLLRGRLLLRILLLQGLLLRVLLLQGLLLRCIPWIPP